MIPIMLITLAYILGIIWGLYSFCIVLFLLILCVFIFYYKDSRKYVFLVFVFIAGAVYTTIRVNQFNNKYKNENIDENFTVVSDLIEKLNSNSYIVKADNGDKFIIYTNKEFILKYGSKIFLRGSLEVPPASRNRRRL